MRKKIIGYVVGILGLVIAACLAYKGIELYNQMIQFPFTDSLGGRVLVILDILVCGLLTLSALVTLRCSYKLK